MMGLDSLQDAKRRQECVEPDLKPPKQPARSRGLNVARMLSTRGTVPRQAERPTIGSVDALAPPALESTSARPAANTNQLPGGRSSKWPQLLAAAGQS